MYQRTSDADNYLKRVGSHATKESKRGIIKAIPRTAEPVAAEPGIVKEYLALKEHLTQKGVSRPAQKALKQRLRDMEQILRGRVKAPSPSTGTALRKVRKLENKLKKEAAANKRTAKPKRQIKLVPKIIRDSPSLPPFYRKLEQRLKQRPQMLGKDRYIFPYQLDDYLRLGWLLIADIGYGQRSVHMKWVCQCAASEPRR